jgi:WD40 repeat protein
MTSSTDQSANPYVGPRAFETKDQEKFFGRERETRDLRHLLVAERIVLLYGPSGAGKTSLINAALTPRLRDGKFRVLPVVHVNAPPPDGLGSTNRYILSALQSLEKGLLDEGELTDQRTPAELAGMGLVDYLGGLPRPEDGPQRDVLIFDQFEEILTVDPNRFEARDERRAFFQQVGDALGDRRRWALFVLREDYLAGLDPYLGPIPTRLATRFRLDLLEEQAATQAIREPARKFGVEFSDTAAAELVGDLLEMRFSRNGKVEEEKGLFVEPVHLQVVCYRLWEKLRPAGGSEITEEQVEHAADVDTTLADYYNEEVQKVAAGENGATERRIREWFDRQLITPQGIRGQVPKGPETSGGLDNEVVEALAKAQLVRREMRLNAIWYELSHDRLIDPVRQSNATWFQENLQVWQREAETWASHDESPDLLLRGAVLGQAERWADTHPAEMTATERRFLKASQDARFRARRRLAAAILGAVTVMLVAIVIGYFGLEARRQANIARARQLAANALNDADDRVDLALLLSLEANRLLEDDSGDLALRLSRQANRLLGRSEEPPLDIRGSLLTSIASSHDIVGFLRGHTSTVTSIDFSPDGRTLASGSLDGTIILWSVLTNLPLGPPQMAHPEGVTDVAFGPDGLRLASTGDDGTIVLWDVADVTAPEETASLVPGADSVYSVDFSPDGKTLASGDSTGSVILWDATTGDQLGEPLLGHTDAVFVVTFNQDGTLLASGSRDSTIILWDVEKRVPKGAPLVGHTDEVDSLDFSPNGTTLASGGRDKNVILWDVDTGKQRGNPLSGHKNTVFAVAFGHDGLMLASASFDKRVILWDPTTGEQLGLPLEGYAESIYSLGFGEYIHSGDPVPTLASGTADGTIVLWNSSRDALLTRNLLGHSNLVRSVAVSPDGKTLASAGDDKSVNLWNTIDWSKKMPLKHPYAVSSLDFSPDGKMLAAATCGSVDEDNTCDEGEVRLWYTETIERPPKLLTGHAGWVNTVAFSPNGKTLATGGADGQVLLWDVATGNYQPTEINHFGPVWSVVFSRNGEMLAAADNLGFVVLWDASSGQLLDEQSVLEHESAVSTLAFSPDGTLLAAGTARGDIVLWEVAARRQRRVLGEHTDRIIGLAFVGQDGRTLATASVDGKVILWDMLSHQPIAPSISSGTLTELRDIAVSPDGRTLVGGGQGSWWAAYLQAWNLDFESWHSLACQLVDRNLTPEEGADFLEDNTPPVTCPNGLLPKADRLALVGDREQASQVFDEAVRLAAENDDDFTNNQICWEGSVYGFAEVVWPACERAVEVAPDAEKPFYQDTRGLARALRGELKEAADDFDSFVAWAREKKYDPLMIGKRERWSTELRAGRNPFDEEMLKELRAEVTELAPEEEEPEDEQATPAAELTDPATGDPAPTSLPIASPPGI